MKMKISKEEKEIREAFKKGNVEYLPKSENKKYQEWAKAQAKDKLISLRINSFDLEALKKRAAKKGKKYQTFIGEILHKEAQKAA
jgi:predicted DNA binding CopG/RHH family protein